jgi:chemotaxis protein methyltransferase CheR
MNHEYVLEDSDFRKIISLVTDTTGIVIGEAKRSFIVGRLGRRLRALGLSDFGEYCQVLDGPDGASERHMLVNAITTNHTSFFREPHHFAALTSSILPEIFAAPERRARRLRIWSAGCATGEEPYSLAMVLLDSSGPLTGWDTRILATDLDTNVVAHAAAGVYDRDRLQSIPTKYMSRYVIGQPDGSGLMDGAPRSLITFKPLNLLDEWPMRGPFDIIFCRNVVIYFDKPTQRTLFDRYAEVLRQDGWLIIGHSESLANVSDRFELVGRTIYRKTK